MAMTLCSMFVVVFFLSKIAPLIIKDALEKKPIFVGAHVGLLKRGINQLY
jgi:hypothetical protein